MITHFLFLLLNASSTPSANVQVASLVCLLKDDAREITMLFDQTNGKVIRFANQQVVETLEVNDAQIRFRFGTEEKLFIAKLSRTSGYLVLIGNGGTVVLTGSCQIAVKKF